MFMIRKCRETLIDSRALKDKSLGIKGIGMRVEKGLTFFSEAYRAGRLLRPENAPGWHRGGKEKDSRR
jgi:hypothetical protein